MNIDFEVKVVAKESIKPSSPTPDHLKYFKLSIFDQLTSIPYISFVLFYTSSTSASSSHQLSRLKSSLSKVLTCFYPVAGRIRDNLYIDCDDGGAEFIEAKVECSLSHILDHPCPASLRKLLHIDTEPPEASTGRLLLVQANTFACGGLAIGVRVSHKFADVSTIITFIKGWSAAALSGEVNAGIEIPPLDKASEQFPPLTELAATPPVVVFPKVRCRTRRFVLDPTKIIPLAASDVVPKPTRVEAVVAFMWRCVVRASRKNDPGRRLLLSQAVNLRGRLPEPLLETTIGNLVGNFMVEIAPSTEESDMELKKLVGNMREAKRELFENLIPTLRGGRVSCIKILENASKFGIMINSTAVDFYNCSSWCRFGMYEAADFGWGRPVWVSIEREGRKNSIVLVDARDENTVEVYLTLSQADMDALDADEELLQFASLNPSISGLLVP